MDEKEYAKRKAERAEKHDAARAEQLGKDLEALESLEVKHGDARVSRLDLPSWKPGIPTLVVVGTPESAVFRRFRDMTRKEAAAKKPPGEAIDMLADSVVLYPDAETYARVQDFVPGVHDGVFNAAVKLAEAKNATEGKG